MKHIHAEQMAAYAVDAMETDKPWERWEYSQGVVWKDLGHTISWLPAVKYRRKPQTKVVDMSVLIKSGIDCEFWNDANQKFHIIGKLIKNDGVDFAYTYYDEDSMNYMHCRPRMNHVHAWQGGECPLPEGVMVNVYYRDGLDWLNAELARLKEWSHKGHPTDIIAFEVVGLADGYVWSEE